MRAAWIILYGAPTKIYGTKVDVRGMAAVAFVESRKSSTYRVCFFYDRKNPVMKGERMRHTYLLIHIYGSL